MKRKIGIGIVACKFNYEITAVMLERAEAHARKMGAVIAEVAFVPGVFDSPLAVKRLLRKKSVDAVVVLGAVIKGETKHDELIALAAANAVVELSLKFNKPVALGVIGPGATWEQAEARAGEYAERSIDAALKMVVK